VAEATEDSLGTYTCVPYNALGTMGMSPPATLVLKVRGVRLAPLRMGGMNFKKNVLEFFWNYYIFIFMCN